MKDTSISTAPRRRAWWIRLRHTPFVDLVRLRITGRLDVKATIAEAGLPEPVAGLVRRVVRKSRLWRSEKVDVAGELIAHFADGLSAGQSPETLIDAFGAPRQTARLIRRAKRRNRPLFWRIWDGTIRTAGWTLLALVIFYIAVLIRFLTGKPNIAFNYTAELNAEAKAVPKDQRAWPLYREALLKLEPVPEGITAKDIGVASEQESPNIWAFLRVTPDKAKAWKSLSEYLEQNQASIELVRQAATRPHLGFWYGNPADAVPFPADPKRKYLIRPMDSENPFVMALDLSYVQDLRHLNTLLMADAQFGVQSRDGDRVVQDLVAQIGISRHCADTAPCLVADQVRFAVLGLAFRTLGEILAYDAETFSDAQLQQLAHEIAAVGDGGPLRIHLEGERAFFRDFIQRAYTDDGAGGGRLTPEGMEILADVTYTSWPGGTQQPWLTKVGRSLVGAGMNVAMANRREMWEVCERFFDKAELDRQKPMWEWGDSKAVKDIRELASSPVEAIRYAPIIVFMPATQSAFAVAERTTQERDAATVAIALELYRRRHGDWPARLEELVPELLPAVPPDRFDGEPLKYRVVDGRPVVYSIGADRVDDGGVPPESYEARINVFYWTSPQQAERLRQNPTECGDWVLWPPPEEEAY